MEEGRIIYHNWIVKVMALTKEEKEKYMQLKPGLYQTADGIRSIAVEDGEMQILETTADGVSRIRFKL